MVDVIENVVWSQSGAWVSFSVGCWFTLVWRWMGSILNQDSILRSRSWVLSRTFRWGEGGGGGGGQKSNKDTTAQTCVLYRWRLEEGMLTAATFANKPLHVGQITSLARILCWSWSQRQNRKPERERRCGWLRHLRFTCTPHGYQMIPGGSSLASRIDVCLSRLPDYVPSEHEFVPADLATHNCVHPTSLPKKIRTQQQRSSAVNRRTHV